GTASDLFTDVAWVSGIYRRLGSITAGIGKPVRHADCGSADFQNRSKKDHRGWVRSWRIHNVRSLPSQPNGGVLGHLLAASFPGSGAKLSVHSVDGCERGKNSEGEDGKRHEHLQPHAKYR